MIEAHKKEKQFKETSEKKYFKKLMKYFEYFFSSSVVSISILFLFFP